MLSLLETQLKLAVAGAATFAVRWKGEPWGTGLTLSDGDMPVDGTGKPLAAIEAEISGFNPTRSVGPRSLRKQSKAEGHLRLLLSVRTHDATAAATLAAEYDRFDAALARKNIYYDSLTVTRIYLMDVRVDDGVAFYEEGNRTVRMLTIPWVCSWFS